MNRAIATVSVEKTFFNYDSDYDYYIPENLINSVTVGKRVKVPFGRGNVLRDGIVVKVFEAMNSQLKEIHTVSEKTPVLTEEMISLALWLKERCFCTTYDCLRLMLPRGLDKVGNKTNRMLSLTVESPLDLPKLTDKQKSVVNLLLTLALLLSARFVNFVLSDRVLLKTLLSMVFVRFMKKKFTEILMKI